MSPPKSGCVWLILFLIPVYFKVMFRLISKFIAQLVANGLGILVISYLVAGVVFGGGWIILLKIATILAILNILLRPILKLIFGPLIFLTLGFFILVINAFMLWLGMKIFPGFLIIPFGWPLIWSTLIMSVINIIFGVGSKSK